MKFRTCEDFHQSKVSREFSEVSNEGGDYCDEWLDKDRPDIEGIAAGGIACNGCMTYVSEYMGGVG